MNMAVTDTLILPSDVLITPVVDLAPEVRKQFDADDTHFAINRPRARASSKIVDPESVELLAKFRQPRTIVDAVIEHAKARAVAAETLLEEAFPVLQRLYDAHILVGEDSEDAAPIKSALNAGVDVGGLVIERQVQLLEDTEVYQARSADGRMAALKIARHADRGTAREFAREAEVLRRIGGGVAPELLASGAHEGRAYLALEWCRGVVSELAAEECRKRRQGGDAALLSLVRAIARAYATLHGRGVIHADVHPRNVMVDGDRVRLIDFGLSRLLEPPANFKEAHRGGIGFFFEPEYAAGRQGRHRARATAAGEQYSLATLLYLLVVNAHYIDFSLEETRMFDQILTEQPLPFSHHGRAAWPELEEVLARALRKDPKERFPDMSAFADALDAAAASSLPVANPLRALEGRADALLSGWLVRLSPDRHRDELPPPRVSVNYGSAGIAYVFYRVACLRDDPSLLAAADLWASRAARESGDKNAFYCEEMELTPETVGEVSIFHSVTGVHVVQALVGLAMGDVLSAQAAMGAFVSASLRPCANLDLTLGRAATLLGCATLFEAVPPADPMLDRSAIAAFGEQTLQSLWGEWSALPPIRESTKESLLGIAHGWSGFLYAVLRWCDASGAEPPSAFAERLEQLAELGESFGQGVRWPRQVSPRHASHPNDYLTSWCNGTSGLVHLWVRAHARYGDSRWLSLAEGAAWDAWEDRTPYPSLCCGLAGRAYAHLALFRHTGVREWLDRARVEAEEATIGLGRFNDLPPNSLYKGDGGVALLAADLADPSHSCFPLFESEGWPQALARSTPSTS